MWIFIVLVVAFFIYLIVKIVKKPREKKQVLPATPTEWESAKPDSIPGKIVRNRQKVRFDAESSREPSREPPPIPEPPPLPVAEEPEAPSRESTEWREMMERAEESHDDLSSGAAFAESVFDDTGESPEKRFEPYKGQAVKWRGVLLKIAPLGFDFTFGDETGIVAEFEIGKVESAFGSAQPIRATVLMPIQAEALLAANQGKMLRFAGTLADISPVTNQFSLSDGNILV